MRLPVDLPVNHPASDNGDAVTFQRVPPTKNDATPVNKDQRRVLTADKINAIENEMSAEMAAQRRAASTGHTIQRPANAAPRSRSDADHDAIEIVQSGTPAIIEEAAVLFANGQADICQQLLEAAVADDDLGELTLNGWWMLLDLYQIVGDKLKFEHLAIQFAQKFETSPPGWSDALSQSAGIHVMEKATVPTVAFSGKLDALNIKQLERAKKLGAEAPALRLEFARVTAVDTDGCQLLLDLLKFLQRPTLKLVLVGVLELTDKIRPLAIVGDNSGSKAPWLLLLQLFHLLNMEHAYEDVSVDFSVTYEVSPPQFTPPPHAVTTLAEESLRSGLTRENHALVLPSLIEGRCDELITRIQNHSGIYNPAIIDCSNLVRVDFNAAGHLQAALANLSVSGKQIELHHINHLVQALFALMGLHHTLRMVLRKN